MRSTLSVSLALCGLSVLAASSVRADEPAIKVGATLELNYTYNNNKPGRDNSNLGYTLSPGNRTGYYFNRKESTVAVNLAEISVTREATKDSPVGFALRLLDGEAAKILAGNTEVPSTSSNIASTNAVNFYEASIRTMVSDKLTVDAGIFPTWVGYETIPTGTSNFFSKSFHFGQFQPFYHSGVKATLIADDKTAITGTVVNNYNGTERSTLGRDLGLGFQVARTLSQNSKVYVNGLSARDVALAGTKHDIFNVVYTNQVNETTGVALDASYVTSGPKGTRTAGYAYTGYLTKALSGGNVIGLRGELLSEDRVGGNLLALGGTRKPSVQSITASYELKQAKMKGMRTLLEVRYDNANTAVFPTRTGSKKNQTTFTLAQVLSF